MRKAIWTLALLLTIGPSTLAFAGEAKADATQAPSPDAQVLSLEAMCAGNADARSERHARQSLYERLGKDDRIHALTREVVRLHLENDAIKHLVDERYADHLAKRVAEFVISGSGGPQVYEGPSLTHSHEHLELTNSDFLAAGHDIIQAMQNLGHGQEEIDEVVCILVGLRDQVVLAN